MMLTYSFYVCCSAEKIYHCTVMPCYDKKLEASRSDFYNDILGTRDVDCVLATAEILDIIREENVDFRTLEESPLESM
jgi:iron only hydrogenase large subunit-like protein